MPFLSVSPWQTLFMAPFYYGFIYFTLISILFLLVVIATSKHKLEGGAFFFLIFFVFFSFLSIILNWNITYPALPFNIHGLKAPHLYNLIVFIYLGLNAITFYLVTRIVDDKEVFVRSIAILIFSSILASFWGILMVFGNISGLFPSNFLPLDIFPRLSGTATEPQVFADFLLVGIPFSLVLLVKKSSLVNFVNTFILILALAMTFSMGGWVAAFLSLTLFFLLVRKLISIKHFFGVWGIIILSILTVSVLSLSFPSYQNNFSMYFSKLKFWNIHKEATIYHETMKNRNKNIYEGNLVNRFDDKLQRTWMTEAAINMFKSRPLFGIGTGNYGYFYNVFKPEGTPIKPYREKTHNAYLEVLAENGIVGFLCFLGFIVGVLSVSSKGRDLFALAFLASVVGLLIHGLSFGILSHNHFWIALGLVFASRKLVNE